MYLILGFISLSLFSCDMSQNKTLKNNKGSFKKNYFVNLQYELGLSNTQMKQLFEINEKYSNISTSKKKLYINKQNELKNLLGEKLYNKKAKIDQELKHRAN